ncbi:MAG: hypothetical protein ACHP7O_12505, partial [Burkholderiales bacterium]
NAQIQPLKEPAQQTMSTQDAISQASAPPPDTAETNTPATVSWDASAPVSVVAANQVAMQQKTIAEALSAWGNAWSARNVQAYLDTYALAYRPNQETSHQKWVAERRARLTGHKHISVAISGIKYAVQDATHASAAFHQSYRGDSYRDEVDKTLEWENIGGRWVIVKEAIGKTAAHPCANETLPARSSAGVRQKKTLVLTDDIFKQYWRNR